MTTGIDTLRYADRLKESGFTAPQAEGMARALGDEVVEQLATKSDINVLKGQIDGLKTIVLVGFIVIGLLNGAIGVMAAIVMAAF